MSKGELQRPDGLNKICIIPDGRPYPPYWDNDSSGLRLGIILRQAFFHTGYLRARGVHMTARLDTATHEVVQADEVSFDPNSPYTQALKAINDDELADPPVIPEGSTTAAQQALLNGYFERTEWVRYVPLDSVLAPTVTDM